jgi:hypothetical protein
MTCNNAVVGMDFSPLVGNFNKVGTCRDIEAAS